MVDEVSLSIAIGALAGAVVAVVGLLLERQQVLQLAEQLSIETQKVGKLGDLVTVLNKIVETQRSQLELVQSQVKVMSEQLKLKQDELAIQRQTNALRQQEIELQAAQLEWQKTDPVTKGVYWIKGGLRRLLGGR